MGWVYLLLAIGLEIAGTTSMKLSEGFSRLVPSVLIFVFYAGSFSLLTFALRRIELSTAYAVWSGVGTAVVAVIGIAWFQETLTAMKAVSLLLIVLGVVGLNLTGGHP
jgi:small multidrug resistance pump